MLLDNRNFNIYTTSIVVWRSSVMQIELDQKKIARSGGSTVLYLSNDAKKYIHEGDLVDYQVILDDNVVKIFITKKLFNFTLEDIKNLVKKHEFEIEYDKTLDHILVFNAIKNHLSLSYTKNVNEKISPANIALSLTWPDVNDYEKYKHVTEQIDQLKNKYDLITRTEGDLDVINILKEPSRYKVDIVEALKLLKKAGKKIGLSAVIRFDDGKDDLNRISSALNELMTLDSKISFQ